MPSWRVAVIFLLAAWLLGCSAAATAQPPSVTDAWVRPSTGTDAPTAAYLSITNATGRDDALVGASTPAAASVEIHETSTDMGGMTGMHPVSRVAVPAGTTVQLAPGGTHLMLTGLTQPLLAGTTVELDLVFEHAGKVVVRAQVRQG